MYSSLYLNGNKDCSKCNDVHKEKSSIEIDEYNRGDWGRVYGGGALFSFFLLCFLREGLTL